MEFHPSITQRGGSEPFELQVARGQIEGHSLVNIYGYQAAIGTTATAAWENAAAYVYPVSAASLNVVSTVNTGDDKTVGTVTIIGLDANYAVISEVVTLNGTTAVATTKSFLRVNAFFVSAGLPTGVITAKNTANTVTYGQIAATFGRAQMSIYTVPAGYTFFLTRVNAYTDLNGSTSAYAVYRNYSKNFAGVESVSQHAPFTVSYEGRRIVPRAFSEKTDIQLQARASTGTAFVSIGAEGILIKNEITV